MIPIYFHTLTFDFSWYVIEKQEQRKNTRKVTGKLESYTIMKAHRVGCDSQTMVKQPLGMIDLDETITLSMINRRDK